MDTYQLTQKRKDITAAMWNQSIRNGLHPVLLKSNIRTGECKIPIHPKPEQLSNKDKFTDRHGNFNAPSEYQNKNIGVLCGKPSGIVVIDIDTKNHGLDRWKQILLDGHYQSIEDFNSKIDTPIVKSPSEGYHYYFKYNEDDYELYASKVLDSPSIDFQTDGKYIVYPGSVYLSCRPDRQDCKPVQHKCSPDVTCVENCLYRGRTYDWIKSIDDYKPIAFPEFLKKYFFKSVNPAYKKVENYQTISNEMIDRIIPSLSSLATDFNDWREVIYCLTSLGATLEQLKTFSSLDETKYDEQATVTLYNTGSTFKWSVAGLKKLCKKASMSTEEYDKIFSSLKTSTDEYLLCKGDKGLAQFFLYNYEKDELLIKDTVEQSGYIWDRKTKLYLESQFPHFNKIIGDKLDMLIEQKIKQVKNECSSLLKQLTNFDDEDDESEKNALKKKLKTRESFQSDLTNIHKKVCSTSGQRNILSQLVTLLEVKDLNSSLDCCIHQLPIKNGKLIDFKSGICRERTPADKWTFECNVDYKPDANLTKAKEYFYSLTRKMGDNVNREDYYKFMVKVLGYSLTGETIDKSFFICNGSGDNGKSLLMTVMERILAKMYHVGAESLILQSAKDRTGSPSSEKVALFGKRIVSISEPSDQHPLSNTNVKNLTGDESITARGVYEKKPITFKPACKFFILCNNKPELKVEKSMEARIKFLPFENKFAKVKGFQDIILKDEIDNIFTVLVQGAIEWYKNPDLTMPQCCIDATNELLGDNDTIQQFIDAHLERDVNEKITSKNLYNKYVDFCCNTNMTKLNDKEFKRLMAEKGFNASKSNGVMTYKGWKYVSVKIDEEPTTTEEPTIEQKPLDDGEESNVQMDTVCVEEDVQPIVEHRKCLLPICDGSCKNVIKCKYSHKPIDGAKLDGHYEMIYYCTLCHITSDEVFL
jgi:hypothetical protein